MLPSWDVQWGGTLESSKWQKLWQQPLSDTRVGMGRRLIHLRDEREKRKNHFSWELIPLSLVENLIRNAFLNLCGERFAEIACFFLKNRFYDEALALAISEQNPCRRQSLLNSLSREQLNPSLRKLVSMEILRTEEHYPGVQFEALMPRNTSHIKSIEVEWEKFCRDLKGNKDRISWLRAGELMVAGIDCKKIQEKLSSHDLKLHVIDALLNGRDPCLSSDHELAKFIELAMRLKIKLHKSIRISTQENLRTARAAYLISQDKVTFEIMLAKESPAIQAEAVRFVENLGFDTKELEEACSCRARFLIALDRMLFTRSRKEIRRLFFEVLRYSLQSLESWHKSRSIFLGVLQKEPGSVGIYQEWLNKRRNEYLQQLKALPGKLTQEDLGLVKNPVLLADIVTGGTPDIVCDMPLQERAVYLLGRLCNASVISLFHGLIRLHIVGLLPLPKTQVSSLKRSFLEIDGFLLSSREGREAIAEDIRNLIGQRDFSESIRKLSLMDFPPVHIIEAAFEKALSERSWVEARAFLSKLPASDIEGQSLLVDYVQGKRMAAEAIPVLFGRPAGVTVEHAFYAGLETVLSRGARTRPLDIDVWEKITCSDRLLNGFVDLVLLTAGRFTTERFHNVSSNGLLRALALRMGWPEESFANKGLDCRLNHWEERLRRALLSINSADDALNKWVGNILKRVSKGSWALPSRIGLIVHHADFDPQELLSDPIPWKSSPMWRNIAAPRLAKLMVPESPGWNSFLDLIEDDTDLILEVLMLSGLPSERMAKICLRSKNNPEPFIERFEPLVTWCLATSDESAIRILSEFLPPMELRLGSFVPKDFDERQEFRAMLNRALQWVNKIAPDDLERARLQGLVAVEIFCSTEFFEDIKEAGTNNPDLFMWIISTVEKLACSKEYRDTNTRAKKGDIYGIGSQHDKGRIIFRYIRAKKRLMLYRALPVTRHDFYEKLINKEFPPENDFAPTTLEEIKFQDFIS